MSFETSVTEELARINDILSAIVINSKKIEDLPSYIGNLPSGGQVPFTSAGNTYKIDPKSVIDTAIQAKVSDSTIINNITTSSTVPPTGNIHAIGVGPGTYPNWGGMVIPAGNMGTLQRVGGVYSVSLTSINLPIVDGLTSTSTTSAGSADAVRRVNEKAEASLAVTQKIKIKDDGYYFSDTNGKVVAKITKEGIKAIKFIDKNGDEIVANPVIENNLSEKILLLKEDGYYFATPEGKVVAKITKEGIKAIKFIDKNGDEVATKSDSEINLLIKQNHPLFGKDIYSFGDSLAKGTWEPLIAQKTGAIFNTAANALTSAGGSFSVDFGGPLYDEVGYNDGPNTGGTRRAKNFIKMDTPTYGNKDVIFFENVHDGCELTENINTIAPMFWQQYTIFTGQVFSGSAANTLAQNYFDANFASLRALFSEPKPNSIMKLQIESLAKLLTFTNGATTSGNVTVTINGVVFSTAVLAGDSISTVIDKINVTNFNGTTGWANSKQSSIVLALSYIGNNGGNTTDIISFNGGSTGVTCGITTSSTITYRPIMFKSLDITKWADRAEWDYAGTQSKDQVAVWKGIIENIQKACPNTKMYMCLFPNSVYNTSYVRPDGSFNMEAWTNASQNQQHLLNRYLLTEVAKYYNIPIIDIEKELNITGANWTTFYNANDVHYKSNVYELIANIIVKHTN